MVPPPDQNGLPAADVPATPDAKVPESNDDASRVLTGKQEHYLKRELLAEQVKNEIAELNSPTALRRFGAPFKSDFGEVSPLDSELPVLRYIFVHHVRDFPFLDKAREKEFWQDKLQVFLESFASKSISSSEDRLEETKRRKLALKAQKLVELMMVSGIGTSSGFEERIRFSEIELVDSNAIDTGVMHTLPEGNYFNGWDVNVAAVRLVAIKRNIRYHNHAEFIVRVKGVGQPEHFVARRYGDFHKLHHQLRLELPGKVLPVLPKKNKADSTAPGFSMPQFNGADSESSSISSVSTQLQSTSLAVPQLGDSQETQPASLSVRGHRRESSINSGKTSPRPSTDGRPRTPVSGSGAQDETVSLVRETQRISLRAYLRSLLQSPGIAQTAAMQEFLTRDVITPTDQDMDDIARRKAVDEGRVEEQKQFYEIARKRAAELDVYMEEFRQDIVERNGLTKLFEEIRLKKTIPELSIQYRKFAEWLRIEVAATIYHLFLAEDNSPELFAQLKRIHSLVPYTVLKNVIRLTNPAAVMSSILDIFLAQPFGTRSLLQRIFSLTLNDGIRSVQKAVDSLAARIDDKVFVDKIVKFVESSEAVKAEIRGEAKRQDLDIIVAIIQSDVIEPEILPEQMETIFNAYVAFNSAVENVDDKLKQGAQLFSYLKQLLKLSTRQRDKTMMLNLIEETVTLQLFRDLFTIFYEPLVRVYKSANVYNSVSDFAVFIDDMIKVVERFHQQDASADPNQTVQAFIDLCARHEHNFYKFVHEVHTHDDGLFTQLMGWIEDILEFLRKGPKNGKLNINALFEGAVSMGIVDKETVIAEVDKLIAWQEARKKWHHDKTRQKMAAESSTGFDAILSSFNSSDFGLDQEDLEELDYDEQDESDEEEEAADEEDPIEAERRRRAKRRDRLRRRAGEPEKPPVSEIHKMQENFIVMLRQVLAE